MSDVSGIPYMGPMGMGNYFTSPYPGLSGGGNLSAGQIQSTYMPEAIQSQNVYNNLYGGGANAGFGRLTDYYSQLGSQYIGAIGPNLALSGGGGGGGGGASPYQTSPNVWDTGASPFLGGGGSNGFGGSLYGSIYNTPSIDWGGVGQAAAGLQQSSSSPFDFSAGLGGGMFGGLGGSGATPGAGQLDWTKLYEGGGGARQDPAPGMSMPGGMNSPMAAPQPQQQPIDYGSLFGQGVGGTGGAPQQQPYTSGIAPDETGGRSFGERFDALGGSEPMTGPQQQPTEPQPIEGGRGGLAGTADALFGYTPQQWPDSAYDKPSDPLMDRPLPGNPYTDPEGGGLSAADLSEQARQKLAELVAKPELPVGADVPLPQPRPEGADAPAAEPPATSPYPLPPAETPAALPEGAARPPADIPIPSTPAARLTPGADLRGVNPRLVAAVAGGATFLPPGYTVEPTSGVREGKGQSYHSGGRAADFKIIGPDGPIPNRGGDDTGMYTLLARGTKTWVQQNDPALASQMGYGGAFGTQLGGGGVPDLMHYDLGGSRGRMVPDVQFGRLQPLSEAERNAMPANIPLLGDNQVPLDAPSARGSGNVNIPLPASRPDEAPAAPLEQRSGVNQGQNITPPPADIPAPAAVKHSGLELARANIDTPIEKIAMERGGQKAVDQINFMAMGKTPRQLSEQYGGMFMDRAEPLFKSLGITRPDFEKAAQMPSTKQDIKMRFAEMPDADVLSAAQGGEQLPAGVKRLPNGDIVASNYWQAPKEGTPEWNQQVYEPMAGSMIMRRPENQTIGGASHYADFPRTGDVEDRRNEQLSRDQLAALKATPAQYYAGPEVAPTALSGALGLGDLPMPQGVAAAAARPQRVVGVGGSDNVVGPRSSAFGLEQGGFGEGGYGNAFTPAPETGPTWNAGRDSTITGATETTNLPAGDLTQRLMGDPFNPGNYNTLDQALDLATARAPYMGQLSRDPELMNTLKALAVSEVGSGRSNEQYAAFFESVLNQSAARNKNDLKAFLNSGYYQPINQGTMGPSYEYLTKTPEMNANIGRMIGQAGAGSNVSNLAMENSSNDPDHPEFGAGAMSPQYGGFLNQFLPGSNEYLTSKLNPFNDPAATKYIGPTAQELYRRYWQQMMPSGTEPWR